MAPSNDFEFPSYTSTIRRSVYPAIDPTNSINSAAGKVVLITGGGTGVGKSIARAFVLAGAKTVAILGRRENLLLEAKEELTGVGCSRILTSTADVLDLSALQTAFSAIKQQTGPIDIVVANAGYLPNTAHAAEADVEDYWKGFEINVKGTLQTFQAFNAHRSLENSVFISLNSMAAHIAVLPGFSSYCISKMAQAQLIAFLQAENPSVRCVSMHPGVIDSDMNTKANMDFSKDDSSLPGAFAVWLAGPRADWVKGRFFWANWDVKELTEQKSRIAEQDHLRMMLNGFPQQAKPVVKVE